MAYVMLVRCAMDHMDDYSIDVIMRQLEESPHIFAEEYLVREGIMDPNGFVDARLRGIIETAKRHIDAGTNARVELMQLHNVAGKTTKGFIVLEPLHEDCIAQWLLNFWVQQACQSKIFDLEHGFGLKWHSDVNFTRSLLQALEFVKTHQRLPTRNKLKPEEDRLRSWMDYQGARYRVGLESIPHHYAIIHWCVERGWPVVTMKA